MLRVTQRGGMVEPTYEVKGSARESPNCTTDFTVCGSSSQSLMNPQFTTCFFVLFCFLNHGHATALYFLLRCHRFHMGMHTKQAAPNAISGLVFKACAAGPDVYGRQCLHPLSPTSTGWIISYDNHLGQCFKTLVLPAALYILLERYI